VPGTEVVRAERVVPDQPEGIHAPTVTAGRALKRPDVAEYAGAIQP
jgi:hypothetical protein